MPRKIGVTTLGARFRAERLRMKWTQRECSFQCFTAISDIRKWEHDIEEPECSALRMLAGAGFDIHFVLTGKAPQTTLSPDGTRAAGTIRSCLSPLTPTERTAVLMSLISGGV